MTGPIGILGGTFDPVHNGHLHLALESCRAAGLAEVRLLPLHIPAHRASPTASTEQRLAMLELAVREHGTLLIDERELQRNAVSYTIDTLKSLRREYGSRSLCLILGLDAFQGLNRWHEWRLLPDYAHIIVAERPGNPARFKQDDIAKLCKQRAAPDSAALHQRAAGGILKIDPPMPDISATQIRQAIAMGEKIRHLLPAAVADYIEAQQLYRAEDDPGHTTKTA